MTNIEAIEQLKFDIDMILFDPTTGEELTEERVKLQNKENYNTLLADKLAIRALQTVERIPELIEAINEKYGYLLKATKYGNKDAEQRDFSYGTMMNYEIAGIIDDILDDIKEKLLNGVTDIYVGSKNDASDNNVGEIT